MNDYYSNGDKSIVHDNIKVQFTPLDKSDAYIEKKSKFLTAKYDKNAMKLIQKRLQVEEYVYDELRELYRCFVSAFLLCNFTAFLPRR